MGLSMMHYHHHHHIKSGTGNSVKIGTDEMMMCDKGRSRVMNFGSNMDCAELTCPKPHRSFEKGFFAVPQKAFQVANRLQRCITYLPAEAEEGLEILDILISKSVDLSDSSTPETPDRYFNGSPPLRSSNPMIHDVNFAQNRYHHVNFTQDRPYPPPFTISSQSSSFCSSSTDVSSLDQVSSSCSSTCGFEPFVRIEGFVYSTTDRDQRVSALA